MQTKYFKNKLRLSISTCVMLVILNSSSALAQQRKPTEAQIQQAKTKLRQHIQSFENGSLNHYVKDYRTSEQKQDRDKFVNAWQQVNPEIAPFLGGWRNTEVGWGIYPSSTKGRVCIIKVQPEGLSLEIGTVDNNSVYTDKGKIFYQEGNYLGIEMVTNNQLDRESSLLFSPGKLLDPYSFVSILDSPPSPALLKSYTDAGCTTSLPNSRSNTMTWQELKTFAQQKLAGLNNIIPSQYPNQFANGQVAMTMLSNGGLSYVVAKEGVNIPNLSSVEELRQTDGSFSAVEIANAVEFSLPAIKDTPDSLYNSSQLIEIVSWASRYDSEGLRSEARKSQQTALPNGKKAYYLKQGNKQGWCTFMDESTQYSDYLCVNIANSPKTSLEVLKSILPNNNTASNSSKSTLPSQELVDAIRKQTIHSDYSAVNYSFFKTDLNSDGNMEAIAYEQGGHCGMIMCYLSIFERVGNQYKLVNEGIPISSVEPKVFILNSSHSGWIDIAIPAFGLTPSTYDTVTGWSVYQFSGDKYNKVAKLDSINDRTIIDFEKVERFNLAASGLATSQNATAQQNTASSIDRVIIPDSFEVLLDNNNNEMKSKFVKGSDGYYTWYLTDYFIPGTCLGLREHEDPTKVQVERYDCDSKKKARKWEIVMTDDNTGYKIKLPNTDYCLGYEKGIFDCDSSQAIVEKLTSEQLRAWRSKQ